MIKWIFTLLVLYLLYKLIFDFILPISKASAHMRNKMNEMNSGQPSPNNDPHSNPPKQTARPPKEDYIDFEEVK